MDRLRPILEELAKRLEKKRTLLMVLSSLVIFVTTYMLILPAFTLDRDKAVRQGGISVPSVVRTSAEDSDAEDADAAADADSGNTASESAQNADSNDKADSASGSGNSSDASKSDSESSSAARSAANSVLTYDGKGYTVTIEDKNQSLPADAEISAEEITSDTDKKQYDKLSEAVTEALTDAGIIASEDTSAAGKSSDDAVKKADDELQWIHFYDVKAVSDGSDLTDVGKFLVNIDYDDQDREQVSADETDNVRILRLEENEKTGDIDAEILDEKDDKIDLTTESGELVSAEFQANGPAVYAVMLVNTDNNEDSEAGNNNDSNDNSAAADSGLRELDLGTAVVSAADGSELPEDADGHAAIVDGAKAIKSVEKKYTDLADDTQYEVFDIALDNVDENEYKDGFKVEVNLPENIQGKNFRLFHIHDGKVEELDLNTTGESISKDGAEEITGFTFETEGFSQFVLAYTVDFEYEANGQIYQYSLPGGEKIRLSELVEILGIINNTSYENSDDFLNAIYKVDFSDDNLVKVSKSGLFGLGNDWILKSVQAFDTTETLTITMNNGSEILIKVTDAQTDGYTNLKEESLNTSLSVTINESDNEGTQGSYNVYTQNYELNVKLQFDMDTDKIVGDGGGHYYLKLGEDITVPNSALNMPLNAYDSITKKKSFEYKIVKEGDNYYLLIDYDSTYLNEIRSSKRDIENNTINLDIEVGREKLTDGDGNKVKVLDDVTIEVDPNKIDYPDNTDGQSDISVSKSGGSYDKTTNTMKYYVTVSSNGGTANGITLEDVLSVADGATDLPVSNITVDSIKLTGTNDPSDSSNWKNGESVDGYTATVDGKKISITGLDKLGKNSKYEIEYTVSLEDLGDDFESNGTNKVKAKTGTLEVDTSTGWQVSKSGIAVGKSGALSEDGKTITWTITVTNNKGDSITVSDDALKNATNLTVKNSSGQDVTVTRNDDVVVLPAGVDTYTITYESPAVSPDPMKASNISNKAIITDGNQTKDATGTVNVPAEAKASKEFVSAGEVKEDKTQDVIWRVTIDVPQSGFAAGTEFKETMNLTLSNPWADMSDHAKFTDAQYNDFVDQLKSIFGDSLDTTSGDYFKYTAAELKSDEWGNQNHQPAEIWWKLKNDWDGGDYAGKKIVIEYTTTVDLEDIAGNENFLTNSFYLGNSPVTATYSYKSNVTKKSEQGNSNNVTSKNVTRDNNKLHWIIEVHLNQDTREIVVNDTLPDGLGEVIDIAMGNGENRGGNMAGLYSSDGATWGTVSDWGVLDKWGKVVSPWQYTSVKEVTPSATINGNKVTITAKLPDGAEIPDYLKSGKDFYFYIEAEVDDSNFPTAGKSAPIDYKNTVDVLLNGLPYDSDDQTQKVTFETDVVSKAGDSSNWNKDGFHELAYSIDINPGGGDLTGNKDIDITLDDNISYNDTVYTYENGQNVAHHVTVSLKGGSVKLQRKSGENWLDIPATEGWGYTLDEGSTDSNGVKTKTISVFGIPNNVPLRLVYVYNVEVAGLEKNATVDIGVIKNTSTLKGDGEWSDSHTENKQWQNVKANASSESSGALTLVKVQKGNYAVTLPNAYFVLEKYNESAENKWEIIDAIGSNETDTVEGVTRKVYKTDNDGQLIITHKTGFEEDVLYRVREYKAPAGFSIDDNWVAADQSANIPETTGYFYFHTPAENEGEDWAETNLAGYNYNKRSKHADNLLQEVDTVYLGNERITDTITADKKWDGLSTWQDNITITLELQDKNGNKVNAPSWYNSSETNTNNETWTNPQTLNISNPTAKWEHVDGQLSDYRVVETTITVGNKPGVLTRVEKDGRLTWTDADGNIVYETWGGTVTNGMATIVNASRTELKVNKIFTNTNSVNDKTKVEFTLLSRERLYAQGDNVLSETQRNAQSWSEYTEVSGKAKLVLTDENANTQNDGMWMGSFSNLEKFRYDENTGNLYELQYFAEEKVYEGEKDITSDYRVEYNPVRSIGVSSGELTVTNSPNLGKLIVQKYWINKDGSTTAPKDQDYVIINLQRYVLADGQKHYDGDFNREHRNFHLSGSNSANIDGKDTTWAYQYNNLQVHGIVYEEDANGNLTGKTYEGDFYYEVVEDTVTGYVATYSAGVTSNGVKLKQATEQDSDPEPEQITVTNTESIEFKDEKTIDLNLIKAWYDESDTDASWEERFSYPKDGTEVSFRLYRYITTERGSYDVETKDYIPDNNNGTSKRLDEDFNSEDNDAAWTMTLKAGFSNNDKESDFNTSGYNIFAQKYLYDTWEKLPIEEVYVKDDSYVKYTYEYYVVENGTNVSLYMSDGKKDDPITGESKPFVEIWNIVGTKFTISKRWVLLEDQNVPPIIVRLERRAKTKSNDDSAWEVVESLATSPNGSYQNAAKYTYDSGFSIDGTVRLNSENSYATGYILSPANEWTIVFANLEEGYHYRVTEIGYYEDGVIKQLPSDVFEDKHYIYKSDDSLPTQIDNGVEYPSDARIDWIQSWAKGASDKDAREKCENYGTMWLYNIEKTQGPQQLSLVKKWQPFDSQNGFGNISSSYTGKAADGSGEGAALVMQVYQRAKWADTKKDHYNQWASEWIEYKDPLKIYFDKINYSEAGYAPGIDQHNGWFEALDNRNFVSYGYVLNEEGKYELVKYVYKFEEVGVIPGSDGRTFTNYELIYPESADVAENNYDFGKQVTITNIETGPLELIKEWKLSDPQNIADKVYFTIKSTSTRMPDVAKYIYESDEISMFGIDRRNVAYLKELDEYVIAVSAEDDWDLIVRGLDIVDGGNGFAEVTYTVEEVAIERTVSVHNEETDQEETVQKIIAVTDNEFPYAATYKTRVRNGQEQNAGNTKDNTATNTFKASGLQIDSARNPITYVKVENDDTPTTSYTVNKVWAGGKYPDDSTKVTVELQQRIQDIEMVNGVALPKFEDDGVTPVWYTGWQAAEGLKKTTATLPLEGLSQNEAWTYTWNNLPQYKTYNEVTRERRPIWYRVVETSAPSWVDPIIADEGEKSAVNGKPASEYSATDKSDDGTYTGQSVDDNAGSKAHLEQTITNDSGKTDLKVSKKWKKNGTEQNEWPENTEIDYKVVRHAYLISANSNEKGFEINALKLDPVTTGTLNSSKQSVTLEGLDRGGLYTTGSDATAPLAPNFTYSVEYDYEIVETAIRVDGNTYNTKVTVTADPDDPETPDTENDESQTYAQIVNDLTDIKVVKTWDNGNEGSNAVVQLYRSTQRPEGKVPVETFNLTVAVPDTNWKTAEGNNVTEIPTQGEIVVDVVSSDGQIRTITLKDGNWTGTLNDLPRTTTSQAPIEYKISVKSVDETNVLTANGGAEYDSITGDEVTVNLNATVPEPILEETMPMVFKQTYWHNSSWQGANKPTSGSISLTVVASDGTEYPVQLTSVGKDNNYEGDSITVITKTKKGETVTYNKDNFVWRYDGDILGIDNVNLKTENGKYVVEYQGKVKDNSSGGGGTQEKTTTWSLNTEDGITVDKWGNGFNDGDDLKVGQSYTLNIHSLNGVSQSMADVEVTGAENVTVNKGIWNTCTVTFTPNDENTPVVITVKKVTMKDGAVQLVKDGAVVAWNQYSPGESVTITAKFTEQWHDLILKNGDAKLICRGDIAYGDRVTPNTDIVTVSAPASGVLTLTITGSYGTITLSDPTANARQAIFWDDDDDVVAPIWAKAPARAAAAATKTFTETGDNRLTVTTETVTDSNGNTVTRSTDRTPYGAEPVGEPVTLSSGNWEKIWSNLPKVDENGNPIYYYVKEVSATVPSSASSVTTEYSYQKHDNDDARKGYREVDITNSFETRETFGDLTVQKVVEGLPSVINTGSFTVTITNSDGKYLTSDGNLIDERTELTLTVADGLHFEHLPVDTYTVTEIMTGSMDRSLLTKTYTFNAAGSITTATAAVTDGGNTNATITNRYTTSTEFTKTWKDGNTVQSWPQGTTITVKVTQKAGDTETGSALFTVAGNEAATTAIVPNSSDNLSGITAKHSSTANNVTTYVVSNLPARGKVDNEDVEYTYTVEETAVTKGGQNILNKAWTTAVNGKNITNTAVKTDFTVQKRWMHTDGNWQGDNYDASTKTIYYMLLRKGDDGKYHQVKADGTPVTNINEVFSLTRDYTANINLNEAETVGEGEKAITTSSGKHIVHWAHTFENLPGQNSEYYAIECSADGTKVFKDTGNGFAGKELALSAGQSLIETSTQQYAGCYEYNSNQTDSGPVLAMKNNLTEWKVKKHWDDAGNTVSSHPEVTMTLYANITVDGENQSTQVGEAQKINDSTTTKDGDDPYVKWENLPIFDAATGQRIIYTATETYTGNGYTKTENYTLTYKTELNEKAELDDNEKYLKSYLELYTDENLKDAPQLVGDTLAFTNKIETVQVEVEKKWEDNNIPENATATLSLSGGSITNRTIVLNGKTDAKEDMSNAQWDPKDYEILGDKYVENAHESQKWKATWFDLPKYDSNGDEISYTVTETAVTPSGYSPDYTTSNNTTAKSVVLTFDSNDKKYTGLLTNIKRTNIDLVKIDKETTSKKLAGAIFELIKIKDDTEKVTKDNSFDPQTVITASAPEKEGDPGEGTATFSNLTTGFYQLTETETPAGYVLTDNKVTYLRVDADGTIYVLTSESGTAPSTWIPKQTFTAGDMVTLSNTTLTVKNEPGKELPHTGGIGTTIFYILGSILLLGGAIILISRRRATK